MFVAMNHIFFAPWFSNISMEHSKKMWKYFENVYFSYTKRPAFLPPVVAMVELYLVITNQSSNPEKMLCDTEKWTFFIWTTAARQLATQGGSEGWKMCCDGGCRLWAHRESNNNNNEDQRWEDERQWRICLPKIDEQQYIINNNPVLIFFTGGVHYFLALKYE